MWAFRFSEQSTPSSEVSSGLTNTVTIPEIVEEEAAWESLLLVKIDIEGGERQLFSENTEWIGRVPLIIIETHDSLQPYDKTSLNFFRAVSAYDFEVCFSGENAFVYFSKIRIASPHHRRSRWGRPNPTVTDGPSRFLSNGDRAGGRYGSRQDRQGPAPTRRAVSVGADEHWSQRP